MKVRTLVVFAGVAVLCAGTVRGQQTPATQAKSTLSSPKTGSEATPTSSDPATPSGTSNATPSPGTPGVTPPAATPSVSVGPDQVHPPDATKAPGETTPEATQPEATSPEKSSAPSEPIPNPNAPVGTKLPPRVTKTPSTGPADPRHPYVIGTLDVIEVRIWNDPKLSGIYNIRPDGILSLPLVGEFRADGYTVPQLTKVVKDKLGTLINDPEVNIQVVKINSKRVFVFGGVQRPGEMALYQDMTVLDALSNVGFKDFANPKKIRIMRGTETFLFNYKDVSRGRHMEQNIYLQNGDRIFVPE
jgi:polysaccharide export outer membrane protein